MNLDEVCLSSKSMNWEGPLSISIGFSDGDYCNANLSKGTTHDECLDALQKCDEILAMEDAGERDLSIGWVDLSNDEGDSIRYPSIMSDKEDVVKVVNDVRQFMSP